jgi:hypothetical protein
MRRFVTSTGLAVATLSLAGFSQPAAAQQTPSRELVPIRGAASGTTSTFVIPTDPPIALVTFTGSGEDNLLGPYTTAGYFVQRLSADGTPLSVTDGVAVATGTNGDAYYTSFSGLVRPSEKPGFVRLEGITLITGGKGRFAGAAGHDALQAEVELGGTQGSYTFEGMITPPKAP